jgi:hypothetical protein
MTASKPLLLAWKIRWRRPPDGGQLCCLVHCWTVRNRIGFDIAALHEQILGKTPDGSVHSDVAASSSTLCDYGNGSKFNGHVV